MLARVLLLMQFDKMADNNNNDNDNDNGADEGSDDDGFLLFDEDERAEIEVRMREAMQEAAQQPAPRQQAPPPVQAKLLNKMKDNVQKKDTDEKKK